MRFIVRMRLTSPNSSSKTSPFIGANSFYSGYSSLRIYRLSCLEQGVPISGAKPLAYPKVLYLIPSGLGR